MPASSSDRRGCPALRAALRVAGLGLLCAGACDRCTDPPTCETGASTASVSGIWTIEGEGERAGCGDPRYNGDFELGPSLKLAIDTVSEALVDGGSRDASTLDARPGDAARDQSSADLGPRDLARERTSDLTPGKSDLARDASGLLDLLAGEGGSPADLQRVEARLRPDKKITPPPTPYRHRLLMRNPPAGFTFTGEVVGNCVSFETEETDLRGTVRYQFKGKAQSGRTIEGRFTGSGPVGCLASGTFEVEIR